MQARGRTIHIESPSTVRTGASCGDCGHAGRASLCQSRPVPVTGPPQLSGPPEQTRRLLQALAAAWQEPVSGPDNHLVQALHYQQGEVSLELRLAPECGGGHIAQTAFDTLRGLLPDTDIYVRHMV